jgi:hypothetical protein
MSPYFMTLRHAILGIALLLTACAPHKFTSSANGPARVAILSFVGHEINALENGKPSQEALAAALEKYRSAISMWESTVSKKDFDISPMRRWQQDISDWKMDDFIVAETAAILKSKYQIVPFDWNRASVPKDDPLDLWHEKGQQAIVDIVRRQPGFATAKDIDAYVLILPYSCDLTSFSRQNYGLGIVRSFYVKSIKDAPPIFDEYMVHALYSVAVVDGRTMSYVTGEPARDRDLFEHRFYGFPARMAEEANWADSYSALSPAQKDMVEAAFKDLIKISMPTVMKSLDLVP